MSRPIYLDYHATTPVDPRVLEAMLPWFTEKFGNAASRNHAYGWEAEAVVKTSRQQIAALIGASPREIVFTSGATESNNLAIKGAAAAVGRPGRIVTCVTEHKAVLDPCARLERQGWEVVRLPVDSEGLLDLDDLRRALAAPTLLVSLMAANSEIGVLHPLAEIGALCRERGALLHVDAAQAVGRIPMDVEEQLIDLLSVSGHKLYAPKGVGALFVRRRGRRAEVEAQIDGGGHERGLRSGTLNVPAIVGLGKACVLAGEERDAEAERLRALRDRLLAGLRARLDGVRLNGAEEPRLPNNLNVSFEGVDGEALLGGLTELAVSSGSACTTAEPQPSHVLRALGLSDKLAQASLRFGLGRPTTADEIDRAVELVVGAVERLRRFAPVSD